MSKIGKGMRLLPYLQANKVICHSSMDADRRLNTHGSEQFTAVSVQRALIHLHWFPEPNFHRATKKA